MTWFGDVDVPILSDKGTAVTIETINTNFVDNPPQSFKLYSTLEQGSYTVFLNQELHERSETLSEQRDALLGMVERHGTEFPVNDSTSEGFVVVDTADIFDTPSQMFDECEIELRYMPYNKYKSAVVCNANAKTNDFDVTESGLFATPSFVDVQKNGTNTSPQYSIDYSGLIVDYYEYSDSDIISWNQNNLDSTVERDIPVRLYSPHRIYSVEKNIDNAEINNQIVSVELLPSTNNSKISDNSSVFAEVGYQHSEGYIEENTNDVVSVVSINNEKITAYRGYPFIEYEVEDRADFFVDVDSPSIVTQQDYYIVVQDSSGRDVFIVRTTDEGAFTVDSQGVTVPSDGTQSSFFVGYVPNGLSSQEIAQSAYTRGSWRRTFVRND